MKDHEEAKSLRQAESQYATLLQHQIEQNLRSRLLVDSHSTLEARRMQQQHQGFPYSLGEERAKVANYVTAQMAKQDVQQNEEILQKFRMEAILFRNNKIRGHPRGNSLPMMTESMLHGGNIADLALQILLPKTGNVLSRLEGLAQVQTSQLNDPKRVQLAPLIPPPIIKVKQKRRNRLKAVNELGKIEGILKDIHVNLIRNSMILREIKDRPHSRNFQVSHQSQTVDTILKNNPKRFRTLNSEEGQYSLMTEASNNGRPHVEYINSADKMEYMRMRDGLTLLKSNKKRPTKDVTGAS